MDIAVRRSPVVALLGPRQVGKTTLARDWAASRSGDRSPPRYVDLESPSDRAMLSDPLAFFDANADRLLVLDEIHRLPGLFPTLRGVIDERRRQGRRGAQFIVLGSASLELLAQASESLAGRIEYLELAPLQPDEIEETPIDPLWLRGGFPDSLLATNDEDSLAWRRAFITTCLERDIPQLGPRIPAETLRRLWTMLAHRQGAPANDADLARSLGISSPTVARYIDLLVDLFLVRRLQPFAANVGKRLVKSPKLYVRDAGIAHALLGISRYDDLLAHPVCGATWEGLVIEALISAAGPRFTPFFYRTHVGAELDLLLLRDDDARIAVEIKRSSAPHPSRGYDIAVDDVEAKTKLVVAPVTKGWRTARYDVCALREAMDLVREHGKD